MLRIRTRSRIAILALAGIAAISVVASACGDDDDDGDDAAEPTTAATAAATSAAASPTTEADASPTTEAAATAEPTGDATIVAADHPDEGTILTNAEGLTLYAFGNDVADSGTSACEGGCLAAWPALTVEGAPTAGAGIPGELGTITRADGTTQVTYKGLPLYRFVNDAAPGDVNGKAVPNWAIAVP